MLYFIILILFHHFGEAIYYDDYDNFGIEDFDYFENATVIDLSVNSSTPYQDDKGTFWNIIKAMKPVQDVRECVGCPGSSDIHQTIRITF